MTIVTNERYIMINFIKRLIFQFQRLRRNIYNNVILFFRLPLTVYKSFGLASKKVFMTKKEYIDKNFAPVQNISNVDVMRIQQKWGKAFVKLNKIKDRIQLKKETKKFVKEFYNISEVVLFKPTKASKTPFRMDLKAIMSYFICGNIKEDKGFALNPWDKVEFSNNNIIIKGNIAICMGKCVFISKINTKKIIAEYSLVYEKCKKTNKLKILLHHSSLPYNEQFSYYESYFPDIIKSALK